MPQSTYDDDTLSMEALKMQLRSERQLNNKLACKVDMLSAMAAMKDELMRVTDERFAALKWEVVHNFHGDEQKFQEMTDRLRQCVEGWPLEDEGREDSARVVAPLVVWRKDLLLSKLAKKNIVSNDKFATALVECLPEFRRDFLIRLAQNFGSGTIKVDEFTSHCEEVFIQSLKVLAVPSRADQIQRVAADAVADMPQKKSKKKLPPSPPEAPPPPFFSEQVAQPPAAQPPAALPPPPRQDAAAPLPTKKRTMWWRKKTKEPTTKVPHEVSA